MLARVASAPPACALVAHAGASWCRDGCLPTERGSPIWLFTGFGIGHAVAQCQFDFAHPHLFHGRRVKLAADGDSASAATAPDA